MVLSDGRLAGLWRAKAKGKKTELTVEKLGRLARKDIEEEASASPTFAAARDWCSSWSEPAEPAGYAGLWQTASMLFPSGSST